MPKQRRSRQLDLIYDWNEASGPTRPTRAHVLDETLRDGLQSPSVLLPSIADKIELLHRMEDVGIDVAKLGLPGSSRRSFEDCLRLSEEIVQGKLRVRPACAGRTVGSDIAPIVEIAERTGTAVEVYAFVGSSPMRALAEDWDLERIRTLAANAIEFAVRQGLPTTFVTEDATRSRPEVLAELFKVAIDHGATRLCLCDTVGHATPEGTAALIGYARSVVASMGTEVGIDWHGHNDRGLALGNALRALEAGADRVHGTALGIGERVGNAPMELILLNLQLLGMMADRDLRPLRDYCETAARAVGWPIPANYPLVGRDAFRTSTGVHAAAILKAEARGDSWLAQRVYSSVPATAFGRQQEVCIGAMSGASNVVYWLTKQGIEPSDALVEAILTRAKRSDRILTPIEIQRVIDEVSARQSSPRFLP